MERAGRLLGKVKFPASAVTPEDRARAAWSAAVGRKIAAKTRVFGLVRSTLVIEVDDIVWQRQLSVLRGEILANLRESLSPGQVTELDFRPVITRRGPQVETKFRREAQPAEPARIGPARAISARGDLKPREAMDTIGDPLLDVVYQNARKKAAS